MKTPILDSFFKSWVGMFSRSPKTREMWKSLTGLRPPSYSATRWWSRFEVLVKLLSTFGDVPLLLENEDVSPAYSSKLRSILNDPPACRKLKMELAATIDTMAPFVKTTYDLEGDGFLVLKTYERLTAVFTAITSDHMPNVEAVAVKEANGNAAHEQQLLTYAKACVEPAYSYFKRKFEQDLKPAMAAFKAARFFSPSKINEMRPSANDLNELQHFSFLTTTMIEELKKELPDYLSVAEDVSQQIDPLMWWKSHEYRLPHCRLIALIQPSSAAAERVFSILSNTFTCNQDSALEDYIELSVMLQYNNR